MRAGGWRYADYTAAQGKKRPAAAGVIQGEFYGEKLDRQHAYSVPENENPSRSSD